MVGGVRSGRPVRLRRGALEHAAGLASDRALPPEVPFGLENSRSCALAGPRPAWLPGAQPLGMAAHHVGSWSFTALSCPAGQYRMAARLPAVPGGWLGTSGSLYRDRCGPGGSTGLTLEMWFGASWRPAPVLIQARYGPTARPGAGRLAASAPAELQQAGGPSDRRVWPGGGVPDADYADMSAPPGDGPAVAAGWRRSWHCRRCTITPTAGPPRRSASACGGRWPAGWRSMTTVSTRHRRCTGGTGSPARSARTGSTTRCGRSWRKQAVLQGRRRRAVDSAILADAVAAQGTVTQLISATEWALTADVPGWRRRSGGTRCRDGMSPLRASMR